MPSKVARSGQGITAARGDRVLLTFTGFHDPFAAPPVAGSEQEGPVLSLLRLREFDAVVLISTPNTLKQTAETIDEIGRRHPHLTIEDRHFPLDDPTDYSQILASLRNAFSEISSKRRGAEYFVGTASGTPQMHACWVLLAASGEIPARLLHTRNTKFVTKDKPFVIEINPAQAHFPTIRSRPQRHALDDGDDEIDVSRVASSLGIVGDHPAWLSALETAALVARSEVPVLILGESGTGKEKVAALIHQLSARAEGPFVAVNCAAIPAQLAESTLFGHKKGAFTGATSTLVGKFEQAKDGTLFLDELGELPPDVQAKLLRAVQEKRIDPIGTDRSVSTNCRIIGATNAALGEAVKNGKFREDLYYRLDVGRISLPPLRDRRSDVIKLAIHCLDNFNASAKKPRAFAPETLATLQSYDWPGNVRELGNVVEAATLLATRGVIEPKHLRFQPTVGHFVDRLPEPGEGFSLEVFLGDIRHKLYRRACELAQGNASRAAKLLGVTPQAVSKFLKEE